MMKKPKLLFVTYRYPHPSLRGDQVRARYFLEGLVNEFDITLVYISGKPSDEWNIKGMKHREIHSNNILRNIVSWGFSKMPIQTRIITSRALISTVKELSYSNDIIFVQTVRLAPVLDAVPHGIKVIDFVDAFSLNMQERASTASLALKPGYLLEAALLSRYERRVVSRVDLGFITAPKDWSAVGANGKVIVLPNGVDVGYFSVWPRENRHNRESIVFLGRMSYPPNEDAVVYFATKVFPYIRTRKPAATFQIVGAAPSSRVRKLGKLPGVEVTGYVSDVRPFLSNATVFVAPMRIGTGVQNKILEAMAARTPVVLTSKAAHPLGIQSRQQALIADEPMALANCVLELMDNHIYARTLAGNAYDWVRKTYSWEIIINQLKYHLREALARRYSYLKG